MNILDQHISDIVLHDYRTAGVFREYGIDFCCGGKVALHDVCTSRGIDEQDVLLKLENLYCTPSSGEDYASWSATRLMDFIVGYHHSYIRESLPRISAYVNKVASRHGDTHPELVQIQIIFAHLGTELIDHALDEENRVFPTIKALYAGELPDKDSLYAMVDELEHEHADAGAAMQKIRVLTSDFTAPDWACNTFNIMFKELEAFENDLHHHVHLENNILFPKAWELYKQQYTQN
jgi:regulator of cell morphogenesis and NO signaling